MRGHLTHRYLIALGSNVPHPVHGNPRRVVTAAVDALEHAGFKVESASAIHISAPLGPSRRRYANAVALIDTVESPDRVLAVLHRIERAFGRRRRGRRWSARVLDLDIVLWSGGTWTSATLEIPHPAFRQRDFVLRPARTIAGTWRDPVTTRTISQLSARLTRAKPLP